MKNENLIHLRVEYGDALESKKDVLFSQVSLIKILQLIKKYHFLREKELDTKLGVHRKIKELDTNIKKLQLILPKLALPKLLKKEAELMEEPIKQVTKQKPLKEEIKHKKIIIKKPEPNSDEDLHSQLEKIQEKLSSLKR